MSRRAQLGLTIIGGLAIGLLFLYYMGPGDWKESSMIKLGKTEISSSFIPLVLIWLGFCLSQLIIFVAYILFIVRGFRVHWGWGLANIFLFPLASLLFLVIHPSHGKKPALVLAAAPALILFLFLLLIVFSKLA